VIALGGPHVTFTVEETLRRCHRVDVVARAKGIRVVIDLARALAGGAGLEGVPGISFRRDGQIVENPPPPLIDVKRLPLPAFHLLPMDRYHWRGFGGTFSHHRDQPGVPFKCTFAPSGPFGVGAGALMRPSLSSSSSTCS